LGANVMQVHQITKWSLFHLAASVGNLEIMEILTAKADLSFTRYVNPYGYTPAVIAARNGFLRILQYLADIGPDETLRLVFPSNVIDILKHDLYASILQLLFEKGVLELNLPRNSILETVIYKICSETSERSPDLDTMVATLVKYGLKLNVSEPGKPILLHDVVYQCRPTVVKVLIAHGSDHQIRNQHGFNIFDTLLYKASIKRLPPLPPTHSDPKVPSPRFNSTSTELQSDPVVSSNVAMSRPITSSLGSSSTESVKSSRAQDQPLTSPPVFNAIPPLVPSLPSLPHGFGSPSVVAVEALLFDKYGKILTDDFGGTVLRMSSYIPLKRFGPRVQ
jgi:hypothetical protein